MMRSLASILALTLNPSPQLEGLQKIKISLCTECTDQNVLVEDVEVRSRT